MIGDYETGGAELGEALYKRPDYAPALSLQQYLVDEIGVSAEQFLECAQN